MSEFSRGPMCLSMKTPEQKSKWWDRPSQVKETVTQCLASRKHFTSIFNRYKTSPLCTFFPLKSSGIHHTTGHKSPYWFSQSWPHISHWSLHSNISNSFFSICLLANSLPVTSTHCKLPSALLFSLRSLLASCQLQCQLQWFSVFIECDLIDTILCPLLKRFPFLACRMPPSTGS